jgi:hypothetical protein
MMVAVTLQCYRVAGRAVAVGIGTKHTCVVGLWWISRAWQADTSWPQALLSDFDAQVLRSCAAGVPKHLSASSQGAATRPWVCCFLYCMADLCRCVYPGT